VTAEPTIESLRTPPPPMIEASGLRKRYGDFEAVAGIDLRVAPGEFFGLLGPNGAGKTSTIGMISCVLPVSAGTLHVAGLDVQRNDREIKSLLGVVPQNNNLDPDLSAHGNLISYARFFDIPRREAERRASEVLELVQLEERATARIDELSGGMARRLVLARALMSDPRLLVLDEPTTGLDPQARHLVWRKLQQLRERGVTMLLTTHYMEEAERLCDRIAVMDNGVIIDHGRPRDLIEQHAGGPVLQVRSLDGDTARLRDTLAAPLANGARLEEVGDLLYIYGLNDADSGRAEALIDDPYRISRRHANLEDVFLRLTGHGLQE
jgi:lipooligosaccharide transport system ATP-binding protein